MKINEIIQINLNSDISSIVAGNLSLIAIVQVGELSGITANTSTTVSSYNELTAIVAPTSNENLNPGREVDAIGRAWFGNEGGDLKIFTVADDTNATAALSALFESREYFDSVIFSKKIVISPDELKTISQTVKNSNKILGYTANQSPTATDENVTEYEDMYEKLNEDSACLSFSSLAVQTADSINNYLFAAIMAKFSQIDRAGVNTSQTVYFADANGFSVNSDLSNAEIKTLTDNNTLHVDSTQSGETVTRPFFYSINMTDKATHITTKINSTSLMNEIQAKSLSFLRTAKPSYKSIGFGKLISIAASALIKYHRNGSLAEYTAAEIDSNPDFNKLSSKQKTNLLNYGFAITTTAESFNPTDDERAKNRYPAIDILARFSSGVGSVVFNFQVTQ